VCGCVCIHHNCAQQCRSKTHKNKQTKQWWHSLLTRTAHARRCSPQQRCLAALMSHGARRRRPQSAASLPTVVGESVVGESGVEVVRSNCVSHRGTQAASSKQTRSRCWQTCPPLARTAIGLQAGLPLATPTAQRRQQSFPSSFAARACDVLRPPAFGICCTCCRYFQ
jgi:hypothetical protein